MNGRTYGAPFPPAFFFHAWFMRLPSPAYYAPLPVPTPQYHTLRRIRGNVLPFLSWRHYRLPTLTARAPTCAQAAPLRGAILQLWVYTNLPCLLGCYDALLPRELVRVPPPTYHYHPTAYSTGLPQGHCLHFGARTAPTPTGAFYPYATGVPPDTGGRPRAYHPHRYLLRSYTGRRMPNAGYGHLLSVPIVQCQYRCLRVTRTARPVVCVLVADVCLHAGFTPRLVPTCPCRRAGLALLSPFGVTPIHPSPHVKTPVHRLPLPTPFPFATSCRTRILFFNSARPAFVLRTPYGHSLQPAVYNHHSFLAFSSRANAPNALFCFNLATAHTVSRL